MPMIMRPLLLALCLACLAPATSPQAGDLTAPFGFDDAPPPLPPRYLDRRWDREGAQIGRCVGTARAVLMGLTFIDTSDEEEMIIHGPGLVELEKLARGGLKKGEDAFLQRLGILIHHKTRMANFLGGYIEAEHKAYTRGYTLSRDSASQVVKSGTKDLEDCTQVKRVL